MYQCGYCHLMIEDFVIMANHEKKNEMENNRASFQERYDVIYLLNLMIILSVFSNKCIISLTLTR